MAGLKIAQVAAADITVEVLLRDQILALEQMGHDVTAVCAPGPRTDAIRKRGIKLEVLPINRELTPIQDVRTLGALRDFFRERRFDVVHTHTPKAGLLGPIAARWAGVPIVVHTIHGLLFHDRMPLSRRMLFWFPEKVTASFSHRLLSQSGEDILTATRLLCPPEKIRYLGNGVDVNHFAPDPALRTARRAQLGFAEGDFVVGAAGRLVYEKGFGELFDAAEELIARHSNLRLLMVAPVDPDQQDAIPPQRLEKLKQSGAATFLPWQDEMRGWYAAMDVFVLPSYREGIPRSCMEAAAMAVPVIATDIRGCREVVRDGQTGLLVPLRSPAALVQAVEQLMENETQRRRFGSAAREHIVSRFNQQQVLERLRAFYREIEASLGNGTAHA